MTIRLRLALLFAAAALVLLVGGGALFLSQLKTPLDQSLTLTLRTRADHLQAELASAPSGFEADRVLRGSPSGTYAQVLTPSGALIAGSRFLTQAPLLTPAETTVARHRTLVLDRTVTLSEVADRGSEPMRLLSRRIRPSGDVLVVALSRDIVDQATNRARYQLVVLGVGVLLLAGPGAWLLTGAALRPVERMRREVRDLESRNASTGLRVPHTRDEIARLAETFNVVLGRMQAALAREQALVADAGHELRTPLTVLKGELELARRPNRTREELADAVEVAAEETDRLVHLTEDLLFLSRPDVADGPRALQSFDVAEVAARSVEALSGRARAREVRLELAAAPITACGNPAWIRRAVDNLLTNALRYAPPGSTVEVQVAPEGERIRITVSDEGSGFPPEFLPHAFDRFTRADDSRARSGPDAAEHAGSGLGLAIVRAIVTRHGGTVSAANRPGGGAEVTLRWPRD